YLYSTTCDLLEDSRARLTELEDEQAASEEAVRRFLQLERKYHQKSVFHGSQHHLDQHARFTAERQAHELQLDEIRADLDAVMTQAEETQHDLRTLRHEFAKNGGDITELGDNHDFAPPSDSEAESEDEGVPAPPARAVPVPAPRQTSAARPPPRSTSYPP